jgi:regulator of cell morphogenesis and NO signaling
VRHRASVRRHRHFGAIRRAISLRLSEFRTWQALRKPIAGMDHPLELHDSARRTWRVEVRRDPTRGRTVVVSPAHGDLESFRASADGYRPDTHLPVTADDWDLLSRAADAADDTSREAEALRAEAFRLLDRWSATRSTACSSERRRTRTDSQPSGSAARATALDERRSHMTSLNRDATVAQIVTEHVVAARVFQRHAIDFCCRGNMTVAEACRGRPIDPEALFAELEAALPSGGDAAAEDPRTLSTAALVARIVDRHHGYLRRQLPYLGPLVAKVAAVHGPKNEKLAELAETFRELAEALEPHLDREEEVLFPALVSRRPDAEVIRRELDDMHADHLAVGTLLARIRAAADGFTTPEWGCNTYRVVSRELEALEGDILRHVHLENHVLMPRFVALAS